MLRAHLCSSKATMNFLLAALWLASSTIAWAGSDCSSERERTDAAFEAAVEARSAETYEPLVEAARLERLCIGEPNERTGEILSRELWALRMLGRHEETRVLAEALIPSVLPVAKPAHQSYIYSQLASAYFVLGHYSEAARADWETMRLAPLERKAEAFTNMVPTLRRTHRLDKAMAWIDSAAVYADVSRNPEWTRHRVRSLELDVVALAVSHGHDIDTTRIRSLLDDGDWIAQVLLDRPNEYDFVATIVELAQLHLHLGDTLAADLMIARLDRRYATDRVHFTALRARGAYAMQRGKLAEALHYYQAAEEGIEELALNNRVDVLYSLGELLRREGRLDESLDAFRRSEAFAFDQAGQALGSDLTSALYRQVKRAGRREARALLEQGKTEQALQSIDRVSTRYLTALRGARADADDERAADIEEELSSLRASMRSLTGDALVEARARESELVARLDTMFGESIEVEELDVRQLQNRLRREGQVMLFYLVDDSRSDDRTNFAPYVIAVTPDEVEAVRLESSPPELAAMLSEASSIFGAGAAGIGESAFDLRALNKLYNVLVEPVQHHLTAGSRLVVIPDGVLYHLPFGMLVREQNGRYDYQGARYLLHDHALSVELSPSLYLNPGGDPNRGSGVSALARSTFGHVENGFVVPDLPAAGAELRSLRRRMGNVSAFREADATPDRLFESLREASLVHIATHATLDPASHLNHSIMLSGDERREDGLVYMFDVARRDFGTPFVVLTGCATAAGPIQSGDGLAGFQYAFRSANVGSVLSTHWLVDDDVMAEIVDAFYRYLAAGHPKDEALRRAQIEFIQRADLSRASPFYWAAAVMYGDASPIQFTPAQSPLRNIALIAAVLVALVVAVIFRVRPFSNRRTHSTQPA
jgi:CHAT domain-containing protein